MITTTSLKHPSTRRALRAAMRQAVRNHLAGRSPSAPVAKFGTCYYLPTLRGVGNVSSHGFEFRTLANQGPVQFFTHLVFNQPQPLQTRSNLQALVHHLAQLLLDEGADDLVAASEKTKAVAARAYFAALPRTQQINEFVEAISEAAADQHIAYISKPRQLGALIDGDLYLHAEAQLRAPVAAALAELRFYLAIGRAADEQIDQRKDKAA